MRRSPTTRPSSSISRSTGGRTSLRVDYRPSPSHSFYLRYLHDKYDLIEPRGTFIGSAMPTIPTNRVRPGYGIQLAHTWIAQAEPVQRLQGDRVVERPADSAGR